MNREKAGELWRQIDDIATASGLIGADGLACMKSPRHVRSNTGRVDILSADASAGHASGFDDVLLDELGLLKERDREFVNGLRSSRSTRGGRFIGLSIQGDAPFTEEMLARVGEPGLVVHRFAAPADCRVDDEDAWHAANPGLAAGIKDIQYMRDEARRALATPADAASFRAYDLNQPVAADGAMLVPLDDWRACEQDHLPDRDGPAVLGVDLSSGYAMSACATYWPETGRLETMAAFPDTPGLKDRGENDGVGDLYQQMAQRGELVETPGRTVDVGMLLYLAMQEWGRPDVVVADRHKQNELVDGLDAAGVPPGAVIFRGMGWRDGSEDVRLFQRAVVERRVATAPSLLMRSALSGARVVSDPTGSQKLAKLTQGGRRSRHKDDVAAASVLAVAEGLRGTGIYQRVDQTDSPAGGGQRG